MKIPLLYGRRSVSIYVPESTDVTVIRKPSLPLLADPIATTIASLRPVKGLAAGCRAACILVCDITRPVPNRLFLRPLVEQLVLGGISKRRITVLIATGLHRPNEQEEAARVVDDAWVTDNVEVVNHFARDESAHIDFGLTRSGTPVKLDRRFIDADLKIATGLVEPHFMAGWSGGRKVVAPGIAHADTIRTLHSARFLEHPLARECNLKGNPLHAEQLEILAMVRNQTGREIYALNTVIDEERRVAFVNFGEIESSHNAAIAFAVKYFVVPVQHKYDVVVTSAAGFPLDLTYYQTVKGMVTPLDILEEGATLIVASECAEGLGSDQFRASQRQLIAFGMNAFARRVEGKRLADVDEWETEMQLRAMRKARVQLFSEGLQDEDRNLTGVEMVDSLQAAVDEGIERSSQKRVAVIPEGPYVVPRYAG